jgi:DegV family protein with EDD domain
MQHYKQRRVAVVTDSSAYLPPDLVEAYDIQVVPLLLMMGGKVWRDNVDISPQDFYALLRSSPVFPKTSQPSIATFEELFARLAQDVEGIAVFLLSDELSGTLDSARAAAANLPDIPIEIVDSRGTSMKLGFPVLAAARAAQTGADLPTVIQAGQTLIEKTRMYFVVDTLEYLHRGGRIGAAAKLLGSALDLKPILEVWDGIVRPVTKVRTRPKALQKLLDLLDDQLGGKENIHMAVMHVDAPGEAADLMQRLEARFSPVEMIATESSPVLGAHGGPGMVGTIYYVE